MNASGLARTMASSIWSSDALAGIFCKTSLEAVSPARTVMASSVPLIALGTTGAARVAKAWGETTGAMTLASPLGFSAEFFSAPTGETSNV